MVDTKRYKSLKTRLFAQDGWSIGYDTTSHRQIWLAVCAFPDCDKVINWDTATLDHYPIPYRMGGPWSMTNLRLACRDCNSSDKNNGDAGGSVSALMPPGLNRQQKKAWWIKMSQAKSETVWGFPIDRL